LALMMVTQLGFLYLEFMKLAQEEFRYQDTRKLALISPLQAPMAVAQGLVPALLGPMRVGQEGYLYLDKAKLALMSPLQAPMAVAQRG